MQRVWVIEAPGKRAAFDRALNEAGFEKYKILATYGRLYDLPSDDLGFDATTVSNEAVPTEIHWQPKRHSQLKKLVSMLAEADEIYVATDVDLEGELIASQVFNLCEHAQRKKGSNIPVFRVRTNSLCADHLKAAFDARSTLSSSWVNAAKSRRVLDRLLGYCLHREDDPWRLSIGRVTSPLINSLSQDPPEAVVLRKKLDDGWNMVVRLTTSQAAMAQTVQTILCSLPSPTIVRLSSEDKAIDHSPLTGPEAISLCLRSLSIGATEVVDAIQENYEKGKLSYPRTDSRKMDEIALKWAKRTASAYGNDFDDKKLADTAHTENRESYDAHNALTPTTLEFPSEHVDIKHMTPQDAVLRVICQHVSLTGSEPDHVTVERGALDNNDPNTKKWMASLSRIAGQIEYIRYIDDTGLAQDPLASELPRRPDVVQNGVSVWRHPPAQVAIERLMALGLARPSTIHVLAEKALYNYLDSNAQVNGRGKIMIEKLSERLPLLLDPTIARKIENVVSNVTNDSSIAHRLSKAWSLLKTTPDGVIKGAGAPSISLDSDPGAGLQPGSTEPSAGPGN